MPRDERLMDGCLKISIPAERVQIEETGDTVNVRIRFMFRPMSPEFDKELKELTGDFYNQAESMLARFGMLDALGPMCTLD